jgi:hypothetical protein
MFDRLVHERRQSAPRSDRQKRHFEGAGVEHTPLWSEPSTNYLSGRTAAFFCYGDDGANEEDGRGMPKKVEHPEWFDANAYPMRGESERDAYQGLVW